MIHIIRRNLKPAARFLPYLFQTSWYWLISIHLLSYCISSYFNGIAELAGTHTNLMLQAKATALLAIIAQSLFFSLLIPGRWWEQQHFIPRRSLKDLVRHYAWPLTLESLRVLARVLLWSLAFILPGLFQYWRLSLVPLIVMLNPQYDKGQLDALKHSHHLIRGRDVPWVLFLALLFLFDLAGSAGELLPTDSIAIKTAMSLLTLPITIYSYCLLVYVYQDLESEYGGKNGTHV